ncbi:putative RNase toxin 46 of polymorphic toxin system [Pseudomonas graminis]|uniref:polymorphic toxin type 46 domain-containing protein n=1 Tax=Pseudomonas graminis TaxID=158627 RepID=UPI00105F6155|nr:polymorphic toxin type 46 domain-containing protein [Pseudomonas graminis]TDV58075.1 putative RNase toxin 46 of polymorphic toxin system [Pseudomonas graminis]
MDFLANIPSWDDIERNLDQTFGELNQSIDKGLQSANDGWDGFTRRLSNGASQVYADHGGAQIDHVRQALTLSYPIVLDDLTRKLASINITEILPVLLKLVREVVMIMGGSVAVGAGIGGAVGSLAFGAGALPGAAVGGSIGLEVGNIILMALGLASIADYFRQGVGPCASSLSEGFMTAWRAEDGLKPPGLDPTGGSAAMIQERIERAARQFASGQEQYVLLLLTAIVAFLMGRYSLNAMESVATRSFRLRAEITNKEFAEWLARNEQQLLKLQELQPKEPTPLSKQEPEPVNELPPTKQAAEPIEESATKVVSRREYLNNLYGRTGDVLKDINIRANRETAAKFFESQGYLAETYDKWMNGLVLSEPVTVDIVNRGKKLWQYSVGEWQGIWYSPTPKVFPAELGINPLGRAYKSETVVEKALNMYQTTEKVPMLRSTSAPILDDWSVPNVPVFVNGGARQMTSAQKDVFKLMRADTP